jgi:hypothetical protein
MNAVRRIPGAGVFARQSSGGGQRSSPTIERIAGFFIKITKRDIYAFAFVCLAVIGQTVWSLHFILIVIAARILALVAWNPQWSPENSGWRA